ncbi:MAG: ChaN family lipoprotein [Flavobacteriaceae bacterium]
MKHILTWAVLLFSLSAIAQNGQAYQLFDTKGKKTTYKKLLKASDKAELILFGEYHDNPISHWLQLKLTKDLHQTQALVLGAEMIERDNQPQLNQYLKGEINQKALDTLARLWNNHKTDYKPLVDFAKDNQIAFVASNIPRRYASQVYRGGFEALETLSVEEKSWIAPLPVKYDASLSQYQKMLEMAQGHGGDNLPKAQAIKDATMGYSIVENLKPNTVFIHFHGSYHSDFYEGIYWYVKQERPELKILTIATVSQKDLSKLEEEHLGKADFILVVDEDMTKTY